MVARRAGLSGPALGMAAGGALLVYVGIKGGSILEELRRIVRGEAPEPLSKTSTAKPLQGGAGSEAFAGGSISGTSSGVVAAAEKYLDRPYRWGGNFAGTGGGDCSGLVYRAYNDAGRALSRMTTWGYRFGVRTPFRVVGTPAAGDCVWWPGHIGIVVSAGRMIHAPHTGDVVRYAGIGVRQGRPPTYLRYVGEIRQTGKARAA